MIINTFTNPQCVLQVLDFKCPLLLQLNARNQESIRRAEERRREAEKKGKEEEEKANEALKLQYEQEKQARLEQVRAAVSSLSVLHLLVDLWLY